MAVGLASDITKMIKEEQAKQAGVKKWEDIILNPYQALADAETEAVSTKTKYDISDAYANYKRAELGVMRNQNLGSGFKRQIASALQSEYEKQYDTEKAEEVSSIYDISSKYSKEAQKQLAAQEKTLTEQASKLRKLEDYLIDYSGVDFSKATTPIEQGGLGYYALVEGGATGQFEITDVGRDFFDKTMHTYNANKQLFSDYLLETDPELYEYYGQNKAAFNKYIAGLDVSDYDYTDRRTRWYGNETLVRDYVNNNYSFDDVKFGKNEEILKVLKEIQKDLGLENTFSDVYFEQKLNETDAKAPVYAPGKYARDITIKDIPARKKVVEQLVEEIVKEAAKRKHK